MQRRRRKNCFVVVHMRYTLQKGIQLQFFIWSNRKPLFGGKSRFPLIIDTNYGWKDIASNTHILKKILFSIHGKKMRPLFFIVLEIVLVMAIHLKIRGLKFFEKYLNTIKVIFFGTVIILFLIFFFFSSCVYRKKNFSPQKCSCLRWN